MWPFKKQWSLKPLCGHWAMLAAQVAQDAGLYVEVCTGPHIRGGRPHAQARASSLRITGLAEGWIWLGVRGREVTIVPGELAEVDGAHTITKFEACWKR